MFKLLYGACSTVKRVLIPASDFAAFGAPLTQLVKPKKQSPFNCGKIQVRYKFTVRSYLKDLLTTMSAGAKMSKDQAQKSVGSTMKTASVQDKQVNEKQTVENPSEAKEEGNALTSRQKRNRNRNRIRKMKKEALNSPNNAEANRNRKETAPSTKKRNNTHGKEDSKESGNANENLPSYLLTARPGDKSKPANRKRADNDEKKGSGQQRGSKLPEINFQPYITFNECSQGLKRGELIQGVLRINQRNFQEAYITSDAGGRDILMDGVAARNRALPGDVVVIKILPKEKWKRYNQHSKADNVAESDSDLSRTANVVFILEKKHPRLAAGHLNVYRNNAYGFALMSPVDNRLPRLMIPLNECPDDFKARPTDYAKTLFIARISNWNLNVAFASGKLMRSLGEAGHIEPETEAMLIANDIDSSPFEKDVINCLPNGATWQITKEELSKRRDLRKECIFTIDPATARDLDDALSCKKIGEDLYEVGVHIADVSHFIEQGSALDRVATQRATSVYLAQKVVPMLPSVLCEQLCSLNPGVERLAYSVIWNMTSNGTVLKEWFGRTVIRSCIKLSYNHAQQMIESAEDDQLNSEEYPAVDGGFSLGKIRDTVQLLFGMSDFLRKKRFESGALRLDQPKLAFTLESKTGLPNGCSVYEYKDSNRMIEEFMLLANMAVGRKIYDAHPDRAILRCHPPPHPQMMEDLLNQCKLYNIAFDISDSSSISQSLEKVSEMEPEVRDYMLPALTLMCTKPFQNAKYFCTGTVEDESVYRHYALNVPIYTHFTSPIRRYPDVLVHRFLTAALDGQFEVTSEAKELQKIAEHCNDKKWAAKKVSEQSSLLFFSIYVLECGPLVEKGVVVGILDQAVDILCTRIGMVQRVYCDKLSLFRHEFKMVDLKPQMTLHWIEETTDENVDQKLKKLTKRFERNWAQGRNGNEKDPKEREELPPVPDDAMTQTLQMFAPVDVVLKVERQSPTKILAFLRSPFVTDTPDIGL